MPSNQDAMIRHCKHSGRPWDRIRARLFHSDMALLSLITEFEVYGRLMGTRVLLGSSLWQGTRAMSLAS